MAVRRREQLGSNLLDADMGFRLLIEYASPVNGEFFAD